MPELDGESPVIGNSTNPIPDIVEQVSTGVLGVINYAYVREFGCWFRVYDLYGWLYRYECTCG